MQEVCARGLGELIEFTPRKALDRRLLKLGGPLIRMLGPALVPRTKHAVVEALFVVLRRGQDGVKALFSQMQTTFTSSLTDDNRALRTLAASAIAHLARVSPRVDPIARQLAEGARAQSGAIKEAQLNALQNVVRMAGASLSTDQLQDVFELFAELVDNEDVGFRALAALGVGACLRVVEEDDAAAEIEDVLAGDGDPEADDYEFRPEGVLDGVDADEAIVHGRVQTLSAAVRFSLGCTAVAEQAEDIAEALGAAAKCPVPFIRASAAIGLASLLGRCGRTPEACAVPMAQLKDGELDRAVETATGLAQGVLATLVGMAGDKTSDVRSAVAVGLKRYAKAAPDHLRDVGMKTVGAAVLELAQEKNALVKHRGERAAVHAFAVHRDDG